MIARYEYDGLNRRTKECLNADTDDDFDSFRHFYYTDGWQLLETRLTTSENDAPETLQPEYQYVWSVRYMDAPVLRDKNTDDDDLCDDQRLYFTNDANMNVTALMEDDGDVVERYMYDPYGKVTIYDDDWSETRNTSSYDNSILFCGYYHDWETGLYHVRNRYYHPYFGWITRDKAGYADGMSLYEYCGGGPLGALDSLGLATLEATESVFNQDPNAEFRIADAGNSEKKCPKPVKPTSPPAKERPPVPPVAPAPGPKVAEKDTRNRSTGQSQYDWETGLKYGQGALDGPGNGAPDSSSDPAMAGPGEEVPSWVWDYVARWGYLFDSSDVQIFNALMPARQRGAALAVQPRGKTYTNFSRWDAFWEGFGSGAKAGAMSVGDAYTNTFTLGYWDPLEEAKGRAWSQTAGCQGTWVQTASEVSSRVSAAAALAAVGCKVTGFNPSIKVGLHGAHHSFPIVGKVPHLQTIVWEEGVSQSHHILRIPLAPWWP